MLPFSCVSPSLRCLPSTPRSTSGPPTHHINNLLFNVIHCQTPSKVSSLRCTSPSKVLVQVLLPNQFPFHLSCTSPSPRSLPSTQDLPLAHPPTTSTTLYLTQFIVPFLSFLTYDVFQCKDFLIIIIMCFIVNCIILFSIVILSGFWFLVCFELSFIVAQG